MRKEKKMTDDRGQNAEVGMRNAERKKDDRVLNAEVGMWNAERKKDDGRQMTECGSWNHSILDFRFQISDLSDFHHATRNPQRATRNSDQKPVTSNK
jgi:hypothetical protein